MSQRTEQVEATIQQLLGEILNREIEVPDGHLITLTETVVTADLRIAKIFISILPFESSKKMIKYLKGRKGYIQKLLNQKLNLKFSPILEFVIDDRNQKGFEMENLIDKEIANIL